MMTPISALYHQADSRSDQAAFTFGDEVWSYRRLAGEAERLARALLARGLQPGDRVALHMANAPELVVAYYACFRIGVIAAPLSIKYKTAELRPLLKRLRPALYLGQAQFYLQVASIEPAILASNARFVIGGDADDDRAQPWTNLFRGVAQRSALPHPDVESPAVLLATSGTTGQPKFVAHTPATLSAVANICAHLELNRGHIAVHAMPMTHAIGLFTFLACVRFGNPMLLFERFNSDAVLDAIEPHHCSWMLGAPVMFADMLERQRAYSRKVDSLRVCLTVGDVWPPELQQEFQHVFGLPLRPFWSSTETGPLAYELQPGPVNRIARGAQVRLVDDDGATAARGEMGELLVRGPNVAVGYWAGPSRIDDATFDGWFHTGDLVRQGDGEDFWFISRKKDLIVSGGSNISPVEVERVLMAHHAVLDAAVIGVPDAVLGQRVAAFVQLAGDPSGAVVDDILGWAKAQLAGHKVPEWLELIDEIPKNAFGKANRVLLAAMLSHIPVSEAAPVMSS